MAQLKTKLGQIEAQIEATRQHQAGQLELFLVINRLEEFAAAVTDRLATIDFQTKREILCALVKRIEIYKDEVVVVFRVDPDPGFDTGENSTDTDAEIPSMQDCTRRHHRALRCAPRRGPVLESVDDVRLQVRLDQREHAPVADACLKVLQEQAVGNAVEVAFQVSIDHPGGAVPEGIVDFAQRVLGAAARTKAVAAVQEFPLEDGLQHPFERPLHDAVLDGGDAQRALAAAGLGDIGPFHPLRTEAARSQLGMQFVQVSLGPVVRSAPRSPGRDPRRRCCAPRLPRTPEASVDP
jgi:hypothetical protein